MERAFPNTVEFFSFAQTKSRKGKNKKTRCNLEGDKKYESEIKLYFRNNVKNKNEKGVLVKK